MKIYSYTDSNFSAPINWNENELPIQFSSFYANFIHQEKSENVIYFENAIGITIPIRLFNIKFFKFGQILHAPLLNGEEIGSTDEQNFYTELILFLKQQQVHRLIQPHPSGIMNIAPIQSKFCEFGTYITLLEDQTDQEIIDCYDIKYKKAIQHSIKNGGECRFGIDQFDAFYDLYYNTMQRAKMLAESKSYLLKMIEHYGKEHVTIGVFYEEGIASSGILIVHTNFSALCTHAGSSGKGKLYGGMKHLHFEAMKRMRDNGVKLYDFVGVRINSSNETLQGIFKFKKGFGGQLKTGVLWKTDIDKFKMLLFDTILLIKNRGKKVKDIIDQEQ